jgi:hypothetical protein
MGANATAATAWAGKRRAGRGAGIIIADFPIVDAFIIANAVIAGAIGQHDAADHPNFRPQTRQASGDQAEAGTNRDAERTGRSSFPVALSNRRTQCCGRRSRGAAIGEPDGDFRRRFERAAGRPSRRDS